MKKTAMVVDSYEDVGILYTRYFHQNYRMMCKHIILFGMLLCECILLNEIYIHLRIVITLTYLEKIRREMNRHKLTKQMTGCENRSELDAIS